MDSFAREQTDKLSFFKVCSDIHFLQNELAQTEKSLPECAAESLYRTNKISILKNRIAELIK